MAFRSDDIAIHLMPSDEEKLKEEKEKKEKKPKDWPHGAPCTMATGADYTPEVEGPDCQESSAGQEARGSRGALPFLRARLREALAPPPL